MKICHNHILDGALSGNETTFIFPILIRRNSNKNLFKNKLNNNVLDNKNLKKLNFKKCKTNYVNKI